MDFKTKPLFVKRNSYNLHSTVRRNSIASDVVRKDALLSLPSLSISGTSTYESITNAKLNTHLYESEIEEYRKESYYYQLNPLLNLLRVLGSFPLNLKSSGILTFKLFSPIMAYSVTIYVLMNYMTYNAMKERWEDYFMENSTFSDSIYTTLMISFLSENFFAPLFSWLDAKNVVKYFNDWMKFQILFKKVTGYHTHLELRKFASVLSIFCFCSSFTTIFLYYIPPYIDFWKLPPYWFASICTMPLMFLRSCILRTLLKTGNKIYICFKTDLKKRPNSAQIISAYRILWLHWCHLVTHEDQMMGKFYGLSLLGMLFVVVITLYNLLVGLTAKKIDYATQIFTVGPCITCTFALFSVCNMGHHIYQEGIRIKHVLQSFVPSQSSRDTMQEVNAFLNSMVMNPPVISALGFANINRSLFRAFMSTIVTYMIVLLQFDKGDRVFSNDEKPSRNVTDASRLT